MAATHLILPILPVVPHLSSLCMDEPRPDRDSTDDEDGSTLAFGWDTTAEYVDSDDELSGHQTQHAANCYQAS
eukprot:166937-Rhodomonas_salina.1